MIADPFTKKTVSPERMIKTMMTGVFDMRPTEESLMIKEKNRQYRQKVREEKNDNVSRDKVAKKSSKKRKVRAKSEDSHVS